MWKVWKMWDWDEIMQAVAGDKLAQDLRKHRFHEEVKRAGEAQERRAQEEALLSKFKRVSGVSTYSPGQMSSAPRTGTAYWTSSSTPSRPICVPPPGSVRPRQSDPVPARPAYDSLPVTAAKASDSSEGAAGTVSLEVVATSRVPTPQDSCATSPTSTNKCHEQSGDGSGIAGADECAQNAKVVRVGRSRQLSSANPVWIKPKLDGLGGPGADDFSGAESKLSSGLKEEHHEKYMSIDDYDTWGPRTPMPKYEGVHVRLARKFRTESSTTISPDGCTIQRGFVVSPRPSRTVSPSSTPASSVGTPTSSASTSFAIDPFTKPDAPRTAESKPPGTAKPERRNTWDPPSNARIDNADLACTATGELKVLAPDATAMHIGTAPPCRVQQLSKRGGKDGKRPKRSRSDQGPAKAGTQTSSAGTWSTESSADAKPTQNSKAKIVPAEETECAIVSEDDGSGQYDTPEEQAVLHQQINLKPSKHLSPPLRGILKKPSRGATSFDDYGTSASSDGVANVELNNGTAKAAQRQQLRFALQRQSTAPQKGLVSAAATEANGRDGLRA